jgi:dTDP-4-amino-4,6-dideoxygalactose transaminase
MNIREILAVIQNDTDKNNFLSNWFGETPYYLVSMGSAALTLSLKSLRDDSERKEVVIPAYTCPSVISSVIKAGLELILCDLTPYSFQIDLGHLRSKIRSRTLVVVAVHLLG